HPVLTTAYPCQARTQHGTIGHFSIGITTNKAGRKGIGIVACHVAKDNGPQTARQGTSYKECDGSIAVLCFCQVAVHISTIGAAHAAAIGNGDDGAVVVRSISIQQLQVIAYIKRTLE